MKPTLATLSLLLASTTATSWQSLPGANFAPGTLWGSSPSTSWPPTYNDGSLLNPQAPDALTKSLIS